MIAGPKHTILSKPSQAQSVGPNLGIDASPTAKNRKANLAPKMALYFAHRNCLILVDFWNYGVVMGSSPVRVTEVANITVKIERTLKRFKKFGYASSMYSLKNY